MRWPFAVVNVALVAGAVWMGYSGHPWLCVMFLVCMGSSTYSSGGDDE